MSGEKILVADDEPEWLARCKRFLQRSGYKVETAANGREAIDRYEVEHFDMVITDLQMPQMDGMEVLKWLKEHHPGTLVLMFTGYGTIQNAVNAMKQGAFDFITKPFSPDQLLMSVERALEHHRLEAENQALQEQLEDRFRFDNIIGQSVAMERVFTLIRKIADTQANVLITGGSGTGKELVARSIHANSSRKKGSFVPLNCGGLPEHLVESELFGHEKGAFTGAVGSRAGLMEHASGGTFFLDEIGELPKHLQVKFLRVLEDRKIRRLGSNREVEVDIRLISATNRDLEEMVDGGDFREDLFYRVNTFVIRLPALRERFDDIPLLANHFLNVYASASDKKVQGISEDAVQLLGRHDWPGNVRELQHVMERAVALASFDEIQIGDLPEGLGLLPAGGRRGTAHTHLQFSEAKELATGEFERAYIEGVLAEENGHISHAAQRAGIHRRTLHRFLDRYGISAASFKE